MAVNCGDWHCLYNALSYVYGECTQFVAGSNSWVGAHWGNACQWIDSAKKAGLQISNTPVKGSVAVYSCELPGSQGFGHVANVVDVKGNTITLTEANWDGFNQADRRTETVASGSGSYIIGYILPPGVSNSGNQSGGNTGGNPLDPSQLGNTITRIGTTITTDLIRMGLALLGFFIVMLGIGLLLSGELRQAASKTFTDTPLKVSPHAMTAETALEVTK